MTDVAARIRAARAYKNLTQEQLAERLGVDTQTIKRRESGKQSPRRGELLAIAAICEVPPSFMEHGFGEVEENEVIRRLADIEESLSRLAVAQLPPADDPSSVVAVVEGAGQRREGSPASHGEGQTPSEGSVPAA